MGKCELQRFFLHIFTIFFGRKRESSRARSFTEKLHGVFFSLIIKRVCFKSGLSFD